MHMDSQNFDAIIHGPCIYIYIYIYIYIAIMILLLSHTAKITWLKWPQVQVTAVSGSIDQGDIFLKDNSKTQLSSINPLIFSSSFKEKNHHRHLSATQQTSVHMHPSAGNYLILNRIITSRWTHAGNYLVQNRIIASRWTCICLVPDKCSATSFG